MPGWPTMCAKKGEFLSSLVNTFPNWVVQRVRNVPLL